jgi:hypothetical protein
MTDLRSIRGCGRNFTENTTADKFAPTGKSKDFTNDTAVGADWLCGAICLKDN